MSDNIDLSFAEKLRNLRNDAGLTQQQAADLLGVKRSAYAYYEIGKSTPKFNTLVNISNLFSVSIDELLKDNKSDKKEYIKTEQLDLEITEFEKTVVLKMRVMDSEDLKKIIEIVNK